MGDEEPAKGPRMGPARHCADALLKSAKVTLSPVRIRGLVDFVKNDFRDLTFIFSGTKGFPAGVGLPDGVYALTHKFGDTVLIAYNENVSITRQKFSVAHELGHLYMGHMHGGGGIDLASKTDGEIEANQFAAQLLMPSKILRSDIKSGLTDVKRLASKFEVSEEAMWWRLRDTGLLKLL